MVLKPILFNTPMAQAILARRKAYYIKYDK